MTVCPDDYARAHTTSFVSQLSIQYFHRRACVCFYEHFVSMAPIRRSSDHEHLLRIFFDNSRVNGRFQISQHYTHVGWKLQRDSLERDNARESDRGRGSSSLCIDIFLKNPLSRSTMMNSTLLVSLFFFLALCNRYEYWHEDS